MAFTSQEEARIAAIERALNSLYTTVNNLAPKKQVQASMLIRQKEIDDLKTELESIKEQLEILQNSSE